MVNTNRNNNFNDLHWLIFHSVAKNDASSSLKNLNFNKWQCLRQYDVSNNGTGSLLYSTEAYHIILPQYIISIMTRSFQEKMLLMIKCDTHLSRFKPSAILEVTTHFILYSLQHSDTNAKRNKEI